jgi:catechol 2,3-dioxygenase-like lactoylglutathione lyase family enzyme
MRPRIVVDHCVIAISDWERSNDFYREALGAQVDQEDESPPSNDSAILVRR